MEKIKQQQAFELLDAAILHKHIAFVNNDYMKDYVEHAERRHGFEHCLSVFASDVGFDGRQEYAFGEAQYYVMSAAIEHKIFAMMAPRQHGLGFIYFDEEKGEVHIAEPGTVDWVQVTDTLKGAFYVNG